MSINITLYNELTEDERIYAWRLEQFERLGLNPLDAVRVAFDLHVDYHEVSKLIDNGCTPAFALQIVR